jgi:hypothetical protein
MQPSLCSFKGSEVVNCLQVNGRMNWMLLSPHHHNQGETHQNWGCLLNSVSGNYWIRPW